MKIELMRIWLLEYKENRYNSQAEEETFAEVQALKNAEDIIDKNKYNIMDQVTDESKQGKSIKDEGGMKVKLNVKGNQLSWKEERERTKKRNKEYLKIN